MLRPIEGRDGWPDPLGAARRHPLRSRLGIGLGLLLRLLAAYHWLLENTKTAQILILRGVIVIIGSPAASHR